MLNLFSGNKRKHTLGFSIVEMSVVLASVAAVIVLTAGGVTMVNKAKLGKITSDIAHFRHSIEKFERKHGSLPGDMADTSSLSGNPTGGDGNGAIDSPAEALYLWQHLSASGMLEGQYDGASTFIPGVGVPASDIDSSGYNIKFPLPTSLPDQALVIEVAGFSVGPNSNAMPILTPEDARAIDEKADDGNPLTGEIFAEEMIVGDCINGGEYNVSNDSAACRLLFVIKSGKSAEDAPDVTGECTELGQSRQKNDSTQTCPTGYVGKVIETCRIDSGNDGEWKITDRKCALIECSGGGFYGDTRRLSCINNMKPSSGKGIIQECTDAGVWQVTDSDCEVETQISCKTNGNLRVAQACDWGEEGYSLQTCNNNIWGTPSSDICAKIKCSGPTGDIGDSEDLSGCGDSDYDGDAKRVCTINGNWEPTSIGSSCVPTYAGGCTAGTTPNKEIGCPTGKSGEHWLTCVDAATDYWTTLSDTCEPITCDGNENIGAVRVKEGAICDNGLNGTVMEYCKDDGSGKGIWEEVTTNCVANICDSSGDLVGSAYWPATVANGTGTATACAEGYEWSTAPTRECDATGAWAADATGSCDRKRCDDTTPYYNNASYKDAVPFAGNYDLKGNCKTGYSGNPLVDCSIDGDWANERLPCTLDIPGGFVMWFDTDDEESVWQTESCNDPSTGVKSVPGGAGNAGKVGCLMDRSGNGNHAVQSNASLRPAYTDTASGQNGQSTMLFSNASPSYLRYPDIGEFAVNTVFAAHNRIGSDMAMSILVNKDDPATRGAYFYYSSAYHRLRYYVYDMDPYGPYSNLYPTDSQYLISSLWDDGSNVIFYKNGVAHGSHVITTTGNKDWGPGNVGYISGNSTYPYNGKISEILLYDSALTPTERSSVESYLGDKWGVTVP